MKYLCLAYGDRSAMSKLTAAEFERMKRDVIDPLDAELKGTGRVVRSESLEWDAVSHRPRGGKTVTTDGPFLETKEQVGGLIVLEARDLNEAVRLAALHPAAHLDEQLGCAVEVRPIEQEFPAGGSQDGRKYLLLAYGERAPFEALGEAAQETLVAKCRTFDAEMHAGGRVLEGTCLSWDAMTVRRRGGKTVTTDGPFLETKEPVGGLVTFTADDLVGARRLAALHPAARMGEELGWGLEVRPIATACHQ